MAKEKISPDQLISVIINGIEDVKGKEITILDLRDIENTVCDYFIVCEGTSNTQVSDPRSICLHLCQLVMISISYSLRSLPISGIILSS